jgi:peptidyl-prolyl cis-trans isomerase A (cyclophilin A)
MPTLGLADRGVTARLCHVVTRSWRFSGTLIIVAALGGCRQRRDLGPLSPPEPSVALAGLPSADPIAIRLETSEGTIHCLLDPRPTPKAVSLFVGLATGRARWRDPRSGEISSRPMYRNLSFFRSIPDLLVQTGCPLGDGTGTPGYRIALEPSPDDAQRLAAPGALFLASYHPPPNRIDPVPPPPGVVIGSQFVIALGDMSHLASQVTVIGRCTNLAEAISISRLVATGERRVGLTRVVVEGVAAE